LGAEKIFPTRTLVPLSTISFRPLEADEKDAVSIGAMPEIYDFLNLL
jgi:hypothetical protein